MKANKLRPGSLTDPEVAIVMALLKSGEYTSQQILGLINNVRSSEGREHTNNGRIAEVKYIIDGKADKLSPAKRSRYSEISPAPINMLSAFHDAAKTSVGPIAQDNDPVSDGAIAKLLKIKSEQPLTLDIVETDRIECKKSFHIPMKTLAAFANNKGGYLLFGVEDKTWKVVGLQDDRHLHYDFKKLGIEIRNKLGTALVFSSRFLNFREKVIGVIHVAPATSKPIIFISNDGDIAQGHIYFRYYGEDRLISPSDLQNLIEERIRQLSETLFQKHINNLFKAGIENAAVLNVRTGEVEGKSGNFVIDEDLLPRLQFIREGEFVEKTGSPTLKLIGDLRVGTIVHQSIPVSISEQDLMQTFLKQEIPPNPEAYIQRYSEANKIWVPIYYYAHLKGATLDELIGILKKNPHVRNVKIVNIREGKRPPDNASSCKSLLMELSDLKAHKSLLFSKVDECRRYARALQLWKFTEVDKPYVMQILNVFYSHYSEEDQNTQTAIRNAIAYVDFILFRPKA